MGRTPTANCGCNHSKVCNARFPLVLHQNHDEKQVRNGPGSPSSNPAGMNCDQGHKLAEIRRGTAGFCSRPSSMADPFNCS